MMKKGTHIIFIILLISSYIAIFSNDIVSTTASTTVTLTPIEDAFIQSDTPDDTYGTTSLYCTFLESFPLDDVRRNPYIMFDLSSIPLSATIISANLELYAWFVGSSAPMIGAHYCPDNTWSELGITWNNAPAFSSTITDRILVSFESAWYSWDIASLIQSNLGLEKLTVVMTVENIEDNLELAFRSKDSYIDLPALEITYTIPESSITCSISESSITYGISVTISGTLTDASTEVGLSGKKVHLEYSTNEGNTWSGIADILTGSPYSYTWTPNVGTYLIRARWDGDDNYGGDTSSSVTLSVTKVSSNIACSLSETTINLGSELQVLGSITPPLSEKIVTLTYTKPDSSMVAKTVLTHSDGSYSDSCTPNAEGSWSVTVSWDGDSNHKGASSSEVHFTVNSSFIGGPGWIDDIAVFGGIGLIAIASLILILRKVKH